MNKNDMIKSVADATDMSNADAARAVDGVFDSITNSLRGGEEVRLVGFGSFSVVRRKATTGRNPRTGEAIRVKASKVVRFKAGQTLKRSV